MMNDRTMIAGHGARNIPWFKFSSPQTFYPLAGKMIPWFALAAILFTGIGLYTGFFLAPTDAQQGEAYRIIFIQLTAALVGAVIMIAARVLDQEEAKERHSIRGRRAVRRIGGWGAGRTLPVRAEAKRR